MLESKLTIIVIILIIIITILTPTRYFAHFKNVDLISEIKKHYNDKHPFIITKCRVFAPVCDFLSVTSVYLKVLIYKLQIAA